MTINRSVTGGFENLKTPNFRKVHKWSIQHLMDLRAFIHLFIYLHSNQMTSHNTTYMQDNKATSAALTGAL